MRIVIVGAGPIGAAASRHLARAGQDVVVIGPDEPADPAAPGPRASHYDEGRIARVLDHSPLWARIKAASIARFAGLEAETGIAFFHRSGGMMAGPEDGPLIRHADAVRRAQGVAADPVAPGEIAARFPMLHFPPGHMAFHEPAGGWLNPRRMVRAQLKAATAAGARHLAATVRAIEVDRVLTDAGPVPADHILVAAGAWSRALVPVPLPVEVYARTVLFLRVAEAEARRLAPMPTLVLEAASGREPYLLPPIRYPDGGLWLKIGGDPVDLPLTDDEIDPWFRTGGSPEVAAHLRRIIDALMPDLQVEATRTEACVVSFVPGDRPLVARLSDRLTVATAGCARGAKASDELGRLGAAAVLGDGDPALGLEVPA